ncbi:hypothetical protein P3S68_022442 [Capsicum galapagoense]
MICGIFQWQHVLFTLIMPNMVCRCFNVVICGTFIMHFFFWCNILYATVESFFNSGANFVLRVQLRNTIIFIFLLYLLTQSLKMIVGTDDTTSFHCLVTY